MTSYESDLAHARELMLIYGREALAAGWTKPMDILIYAWDRERKLLTILATDRQVRDLMADEVWHAANA